MKAISINKFGKYEIPMRDEDGYFHATTMCKIFGKQMEQYRRLETTKAYIRALSSKAGIPALLLIKTKKGGWDEQTRGTWIHPKMAIHLAQWLSPEFSVFVTELVFDWQQKAIEPPKVAKIEQDKPKKAIKREILTGEQLVDLQCQIAIAIENSWPAGGVVRTVEDYCHALAAHFGVFSYSQILSQDIEAAKNYVDGLAGVKPFECKDMILRRFNGVENLTDIEKFEQKLATLVGDAMNLVRERPLKRGMLG